MKEKGMKGVVVTWLDGGQVDGEFAESILKLGIAGTLNRTIVGFQRVHSGPVLQKTRSDLVERFLLTDAEWMLMIDSDMKFEPDLLDQLLEHADPETVPVLGPLCYSVNQDGPFPVMYKVIGNRFANYASPAEDSLLQVDGLGAACLLVHRTAFEKISQIEDWPGRWFDILFFGDEPLGEDLSFMLRLRQAGVPVHVHTGIPIGHVKWKLVVDRSSFVKWRQNHRFVVTGTGRSGTGYFAAVMSAVGTGCGHETIFRPGGPVDWHDLRGDSSWMAAPFLEEFRRQHPGGKVLHLLRNPLDVVNSLVGIGFFDDDQKEAHGEYRAFAEMHCPHAFLPLDPIERAVTFVIDWNTRIEPWADLRVKVEDLTPAAVQVALAEFGSEPQLPFIEKQMAKVPTNVNSRPRASLTWDDMPQRLKDHAINYGYRVDA